MSSTFQYGAHVSANGIRQHYLRFGGRGPALVIVPGITSPAATWDFVGEALGEQFDTYILDVRGRGLSEAGPHLEHGTAVYAADVAAFAGAMRFTRFHVLGHSLGARVAARLAASAPGALERLILADPPVSGPGRRPYVKSLPFYLDAIREAQCGGLDHEAMRKTYPTWSDAQLRRRAEWLHTCDETAIAASYASFQDDDFHADLPRIQAQTLLMVAGRGDVIREEELLEIEDQVLDLKVARFPHAGHMIPFDDARGFTSCVLEFLGTD
ncbi:MULTISPECIES: alpha/beta hydrolase [unclassified Caballeronia]|uniref:alpha/beta fold hydrolase n=1 Tax=unclassified Caballeronia TaxID=2646786 RepID=UPI0028655380|nr:MULTISPECIES: alpha/beta hydrolase [unclassified Caballeronia]MDR5815085.1 alpha/beta hydrolase [Caballeronia sp. LZ033]MDR5821554.1 alpha/beta hydrolase [Caballeronia sp. LZ043]MDR5879777.1 alpha/beta hydrolase [Caballeronia sp. LZ032]